jgi:hypothetical protein
VLATGVALGDAEGVGRKVPAESHWKVLVASSNGNEYAVGHASLRYWSQGSTLPVQIELLFVQDMVATVSFQGEGHDVDVPVVLGGNVGQPQHVL